mmetsp:Transcript_21625/g.39114  ORF Transcript_21625/g.39114 Transcript_21625/m.39114 type:complete len:126 (-) Transcript_21625:92-469(-)
MNAVYAPQAKKKATNPLGPSMTATSTITISNDFQSRLKPNTSNVRPEEHNDDEPLSPVTRLPLASILVIPMLQGTDLCLSSICVDRLAVLILSTQAMGSVLCPLLSDVILCTLIALSLEGYSRLY